MPEDFIAVYRVVAPIIFGAFVATPGLVLTVWPRSETHTLSLCRTSDAHVLQHCGVAPGLLYGLVLEWEDAGIIAPLSAGVSLTSLMRSA